jgi:hypothetical protein
MIRVNIQHVNVYTPNGPCPRPGPKRRPEYETNDATTRHRAYAGEPLARIRGLSTLTFPQCIISLMTFEELAHRRRNDTVLSASPTILMPGLINSINSAYSILHTFSG